MNVEWTVTVFLWVLAGISEVESVVCLGSGSSQAGKLQILTITIKVTRTVPIMLIELFV